MADLNSKLAPIASLSDNKAKVDAYNQLITEIFTAKSVDPAKAFVNHLLDSDVPLIVSR
jgi:hypothetical protein